MRPISSHLDQTNLVNKGFIIWLSGKFFLRDTAGSPERARWLHLARWGGQSHCVIWVILPARGASHIIKNVKKELILVQGMETVAFNEEKQVLASSFFQNFLGGGAYPQAPLAG